MTGLQLDPVARTVRNQESETVRVLADPDREKLPTRAPDRLPHAGSAVVPYAEAHGAGIADLVGALLFHAYGVDGKDIGDPEVLRRLLPTAFA